MRKIDIFIVNAFTKMFQGNRAGVCPLEDWLPDHLMQLIASENNVSETAFLKKIKTLFYTLVHSKSGNRTLVMLPAAHILFNEFGYKNKEIKFHTFFGEKLSVINENYLLMDFPSIQLQQSNDDLRIVQIYWVHVQPIIYQEIVGLRF